METKTSIRAQIRNQKRLLTENFQREAEKQCLDKLCRTREWQQADTILTYVSYNREMGTHLLIEKAFECGKKVAAPRVEGHEMRFYYFSSNITSKHLVIVILSIPIQSVEALNSIALPSA